MPQASYYSTAAPSGTAVTLRAGWAMPGVEGTYKRYENAGNQVVGRACSGLPLDEKFLTTHPFFFKKSKGWIFN